MNQLVLNVRTSMNANLEYSFVFSDRSRRTLFSIVNYASRLCADNNVPVDRVGLITYQLTTALAQGKILSTDIKLDDRGFIYNITSIRIDGSGSIVCSR